jgi:hypothetical protein
MPPKKTIAKGSNKPAARPPHTVCRDAEVPDFDEDNERNFRKTERLHKLGPAVAAAFAECTGTPQDGERYIDPRTALAILLHRLTKTNLDLVTVYGSALAQQVGGGSGTDTDEMARKVADSFHQAADHNMRLQTRFKSMYWVREHPGFASTAPGFCDNGHIPDQGDDINQADKIKRLHKLGQDVAAAFAECTGTDYFSPDYIDARIALAILLVYLAATNLELIRLQGSALGGVPAKGAGDTLDRSAVMAAESFFAEADHNVRLQVRYKSLEWVGENKKKSSTSRAARAPR